MLPSFDRFSAIRRYRDLACSPDGRWVAYTADTSGRFDVWRQATRPAADGRLASPVQLTAFGQQIEQGERSAQGVAWSPDGRWILALVDEHGEETFQIARIPVEGGPPEPVTDRPGVRYQTGPRPFSPDGERIAYACNERTPTDLDLVVRHLASGDCETVLAGDATYFPADWSPDGTRLLALKFHSNTHQEVLCCDLATRTSRVLALHAGEARCFPGPWRPDGAGFYLLTDRERDVMGLAFLDVRTDAIAWLATPPWDVVDVAVSPRGGLAWLVNEDGYSRLYASGLAGEHARLLPLPGDGVATQLCADPVAHRLAFYFSSPSEPETPYLLDLVDPDSTRLTPLGQSFVDGSPPERMVMPDLVRYTTFDGRAIPAFLFRPPGASAAARVPVVLSIHGGPESQELPRYAYDGLYQYLLARGIGVMAPNIRGSTGYGKAYQRLVYRDWGGAERRDLEHAVRYLSALPWVDAGRFGVFGASFGGFAALTCLARVPAAWAAGVDFFGPSDLVTFTRAVPPTWRRLIAQWIGDPDDDADLLRERSPITYAERIRAPLLVVQGAHDPRVTKADSDRLVDRLRAQGTQVEYLVFEDEGHGFEKSANRLRAFRAAARWLEDHLLA